MPKLARMPHLVIPQSELSIFGKRWIDEGERFEGRTAQGQLCAIFDNAVGKALATMLGGVAIVKPKGNSLIPEKPDCVEVGPVRVIGGVRPQAFDVGYRPDGVRFVLDTKTLNVKSSFDKNWQNMVNDLATEAAGVHSRFPHAIVAFIVALPRPCIAATKEATVIETLRRVTGRVRLDEPAHVAEVISLVIWNPADGTICADTPHSSSVLRIEKFSEQVEARYFDRYSAFPPHTI